MKKTSLYVKRSSRSDGSRSRCFWSRSSRPLQRHHRGIREREASRADDLEARAFVLGSSRIDTREHPDRAAILGRRVQVGAVVEQPIQGLGPELLEREHDDGVRSAVTCVHIGAVGHEELGHAECRVSHRAYERPVVPLVDVGAVLDHPLRHGEPCLAGWPAAEGSPRQGRRLARAKCSAVELRVKRHESLDLLQVLGLDGQLELPGQVGFFGEFANRFFGVGRHDNFLYILLSGAKVTPSPRAR